MRISDWSSDVCSSDLFGDKRASAGKGNGLDDLGQRQPHEAGSSDSRGGDALPKLSGPFAKLFTGENRLSKRQRLLLIFSGTIAILFAFGGLVNIVLGVSRFISDLLRGRMDYDRKRAVEGKSV